MSDNPIIMVDTCVWLDIFIPGRPLREESLSFFEAARAHDAELLFTMEIARAVFRNVGVEAKRWVRSGGDGLTESSARAIAQHSWDFIEDMREWGTPIGSSPADLWIASKLRDDHAGFEDGLIIGACMRLGVDYLVTNDEALIRHAPVATVTPHMMVKLLEAGIRA